MKTNISYLCDRLKCERCSYPECERTLDIKHAKNFMVFYSSDGEVLGAVEIAVDLTVRGEE